MYCVYWIKLREHSNLFIEGYIGISKDFEERMRAHKKNKRKSHLTYAINKYGWYDLDKIILYEDLDLNDALSIEADYRPTENIGWNSQRGGEIGVNPEWYLLSTNKEQHSDATSKATKLGISLKDTTEARAERARHNWLTGSYKDSFKGSKNPRAILNEEQVRQIKHELIPSGLKDHEIAGKFDVGKHVISSIRYGKNWKHI